MIKHHTEYRLRIEQDQTPMNPRTEHNNAGVLALRHSRYELGDIGGMEQVTRFLEPLMTQYIQEANFPGDLDDDQVICPKCRADAREPSDNCNRCDHSGWISNPFEIEIEQTFNGQNIVELLQPNDLAHVGRIIEMLDEGGLLPEGTLCKPVYLYDHSGITVSHSPFSCHWDSGQVGWHLWMPDGSETLPDPDATLTAELETYDQYLRGEVYGFVVEARPAVAFGFDGSPLKLADGDLWYVADSCWGFYGSDPRTNGITEHLSDDWKPLLDELE